MTLQPGSLEELRSVLADANHSAGRITHVDLSALQRVLAHTPEDMTVRVEAGVTLADLQRQLAERGQWLPIDPPNPTRLSIHTLLDTNASGPRRFGYGTIRDYLLGVRVALADGRVIQSGGNVVKNVAGYDLMKLFVGAQGSLGVIVEAAFKLLPLPETERFVQAHCESAQRAGQLLQSVLDSELTPIVLDLVLGDTSREVGTRYCVVVGFAGSEEDVEWQLNLARRLGLEEPANLQYEAAFFAPDRPVPARVSVLPSRLVETLDALGAVPFVARAGNGLVWHRGRLASVNTREPAKLGRLLKDAFDPNHILPQLPL
jgi:FAD/FMN-containing dehydrogenase